MTRNYHTPISFHAAMDAATLNNPLGELDAALYNVLTAGFEYTALAEAPAAPDADALWFNLNGEFYKRLPGGSAVKLGYEIGYILARDIQVAGTSGGDFTQGAWRTRVLNTLVADNMGIASLASNQLTLPAGIYYVTARCPGRRVDSHQCRLYDITGSTVLLTGTPAFSDSTDATPASPGQTDAWLEGQITLTVESVIELQHQCITTRAVDGFGFACSFDLEVYSELELWQVVTT
jgi:hypothetical protein